MGTAEIMIVFSALMALIALVTIGIDWIGKPLKHRRFIPRIYRFEDEKLPIDQYGNTTFDVDPGAVYATPQPTPYLAPPMQPYPVQPYPVQPHPMARQQMAAAPAAELEGADPTVAVPKQPAPRQVATIDSDIAASATASRSAFTDSLSKPRAPTPEASDHGLIAGTAAATAAAAAASVEITPGQAWNLSMPLDTTIDDQKPSLAIKAERFWMATAQASQDSHFDTDDIDRMASGKAPRRSNPRTGRTEAMQLTGLRQASERQDVRMRWPDDSVDPWSAT